MNKILIIILIIVIISSIIGVLAIILNKPNTNISNNTAIATTTVLTTVPTVPTTTILDTVIEVFCNTDTNNVKNIPPNLNDAIAISAGYGHILALKRNGTVVAWGTNDYNQTDVPPGLDGVIAISAGDYHSLALKNDGTIVGWGYNAFDQASNQTLTNGLKYIAISAGGMHSVGLVSDGTIRAWGYNGYGQLDIPSGLPKIIAISAGFYHTLALTEDKNVTGWGGIINTNYGQVDIPENLRNKNTAFVKEISASGNQSVILQEDGTITILGQYQNDPLYANINYSINSRISAGYYFIMYIVNRLPLQSVGHNYNEEFPTNVYNPIDFKAGYSFSVILRYK